MQNALFYIRAYTHRILLCVYCATKLFIPPLFLHVVARPNLYKCLCPIRTTTQKRRLQEADRNPPSTPAHQFVLFVFNPFSISWVNRVSCKR
jgi:hypothetical protein